MSSHTISIKRDHTGPNTISPHISSSSSVDDPSRLELMWQSREEQQIKSWQQTCMETAEAHKKKSHLLKCMYNALSIPMILLPLVIGSFTIYIVNPIVMASILLVISFCNGLLIFFNLGRLIQLHHQFEAEYRELYINIERTLCKPKKNRIACDMYLERISGALTSLDKRAPTL